MAETVERIYLGDDNSIDLGFKVNGAPRTDAITRVFVELYDAADPSALPVIIDSNVVADQSAFDYTNPAKIIFAFGRLPQLADKVRKTFYAEVRLFDIDGNRIKVTSVKSDDTLPTLTLKVFGAPY